MSAPPSSLLNPTGAPRLRLREFRPEDRDALTQLHADPRVAALLIDGPDLAQPRVAASFIDAVQRHYRAQEGTGVWCAEHWAPTLDADALAEPELREMLSDEALAEMARLQPHFAGWFSLMPVPGQPQHIEIGCCLPPAHWGSGLVLDGGERLLDHAFDTLALPRVWGVCHPQHRSVQFVLRSLGFGFDGERPHDGVPAHWFCVTPAQWRQVRALPRRQRARQGLAQKVTAATAPPRAARSMR